MKMGDTKLVDTMMLDGLIDAFHGYHMGITGTWGLMLHNVTLSHDSVDFKSHLMVYLS